VSKSFHIDRPPVFHIDPQTLDFTLPEELIAQTPMPERDQARLMVLDRASGTIDNKIFANIIDHLRAGDVLVVNKAKVDPVKLIGHKKTGGKVEMIFLGKAIAPNEWRALIRPLVKDETEVHFDNGLTAVIAGRGSEGEFRVRFDKDGLKDLLRAEGQVPLPPYIKRAESDERRQRDQVDYQTVYAAAPGSIAAPTAGLHFTQSLLDALKEKGVEILQIVLHVGWGTFRPISSVVDNHRMLGEAYEVKEEIAERLRLAKREGRRVIAVGTTCTRTLETIVDEKNPLAGESALFIKPGFNFRMLDGLVTNLHVPRSTPVALTAAFAGLPLLEKAYASAIKHKYRFYSYGDAMLIL
jgi:S-adenosylmethionine:tRNA ribosyltransferase-isomerase